MASCSRRRPAATGLGRSARWAFPGEPGRLRLPVHDPSRARKLAPTLDRKPRRAGVNPSRGEGRALRGPLAASEIVEPSLAVKAAVGAHARESAQTVEEGGASDARNFDRGTLGADMSRTLVRPDGSTSPTVTHNSHLARCYEVGVTAVNRRCTRASVAPHPAPRRAPACGGFGAESTAGAGDGAQQIPPTALHRRNISLDVRDAITRSRTMKPLRWSSLTVASEAARLRHC
jgi:hypothetical protein